MVRDIIKNWNRQMYGPVTLEDVCIQPVNRLNIATAFSDLLCKYKSLLLPFFVNHAAQYNICF